MCIVWERFNVQLFAERDRDLGEREARREEEDRNTYTTFRSTSSPFPHGLTVTLGLGLLTPCAVIISVIPYQSKNAVSSIIMK